MKWLAIIVGAAVVALTAGFTGDWAIGLAYGIGIFVGAAIGAGR